MFLPRWVLFVSVGIILIFALVVVIVLTIVLTTEDTKPNYSFNSTNGSDIISNVTMENISFNTTTVPTTHPNDEKRLSNEVYDEISNNLSTGAPTPRLFGLFEQIPIPNIFGYLSTAQEMIKESSLCIVCRSVIDALLRYYDTNKSQEGLRSIAYSLCVQLQIQPEEVCAGVIDLNMPTITYIINNTEGLSSDIMCGIVLQSSGCAQDDPRLDWTLDVDLGTKPDISDVRNEAAGDPMTIIQISDIHHDPIYTPNGNAECGEPMCCRSKQGQPKTPGAAAGFWGDYRYCDLSWDAFEDALEQIKTNQEKIDYIYMTGDIVDHAVWDTSVEKNKETITKVLEEIKNKFPDIPVYPILGNHEPSPLNVYAPVEIKEPSVSTNWLYELIAEEWSAWLPEETKETILKGGFYTVLAKPGFRIIGLNNNLCYTFNWWLLYDIKDPAGQLKWLVDTLLQAEKDGEKVHILGHIPPGDGSCQRTWSREYRKIIDRFEGTVTAQFNGHTHKDEFEIFYSMAEPTRAINIAFNGGSVTQYEFLNSNYKVYTMDSSTYSILDGGAWTYNLTSANLHGNQSAPEWFQLYTYKKDFGLESLSPSDFDKLAHKMATDTSLLQKYARYYVKDADPGLNCDENCLSSKLCNLATSQVGDATQCNRLLQEFQSKK